MSTILLVEDNELSRDMLSRRLERRGYRVVAAVDGQDGISQAQQCRPDLVIMDMGLPILDGWEATRRLKSSPDTCRIPVLGLSAHAMPEERARAMESGCDDYDTKPVDMQRLLLKIIALLATGKKE